MLMLANAAEFTGLYLGMGVATAVGVGTAVYARGIEALGCIAAELSELCDRLAVGSLAEARGAALEHGEDTP